MDDPVRAVSALVLVDAQSWLLEGPAAVPAASTVTARLADVLTAARQAGALVVYLQNDGSPGSPDEPGTAGWTIHASVAAGPGETVLRKTTDDGFEGTRLAEILAAAGVNRLAVAGLLSEMCVSATVRAALARSLEVVLIRDAHATFDLDDIPSTIVSRVAEHALGDQVEFAPAADVVFRPPTEDPG